MIARTCTVVTMLEWPMCARAGCENLAALSIESHYCYCCTFDLPPDFEKCVFCGETIDIDSADTPLRDLLHCGRCDSDYLLPLKYVVQINAGPARV